MNHELMQDQYRRASRWAWPLGPRQALTLRAAPLPRALRVEEGRVWLTRSGDACLAEDIWLEAGEGQTLPAGSAWVAEGWPQASVSVLELPQPAFKRPSGRAWLASWRWPWRGPRADAACGAAA